MTYVWKCKRTLQSQRKLTSPPTPPTRFTITMTRRTHKTEKMETAHGPLTASTPQTWVVSNVCWSWSCTMHKSWYSMRLSSCSMCWRALVATSNCVASGGRNDEGFCCNWCKKLWIWWIMDRYSNSCRSGCNMVWSDCKEFDIARQRCQKFGKRKTKWMKHILKADV